MAENNSKITGIKNEITADDLGVIRHFSYFLDYGILGIEKSGKFGARVDGQNVVLESGVMFAYGYFGYLPESISIPFIKTSAVQYRFIYAEFDKSVVPNTFKIKVKNNLGSNKILSTTFRQDVLSIIKTGVFQVPLWQVKLDSTGIADIDGLVDLRQINLVSMENGNKIIPTDSNYRYPYKAQYSDYATTVTGTIDSSVVGTTQQIDAYINYPTRIATLEYVHKQIQQEIDIFKI